MHFIEFIASEFSIVSIQNKYNWSTVHEMFSIEQTCKKLNIITAEK